MSIFELSLGLSIRIREWRKYVVKFLFFDLRLSHQVKWAAGKKTPCPQMPRKSPFLLLALILTPVVVEEGCTTVGGGAVLQKGV